MVGCDRGRGSYAQPTGPAPRVVDVLFTDDPKADNPVGVRCTVGTGTSCVDVRLQPRVIIQFDRIMGPGSVARAHFKIASGTIPDQKFKSVRVDPVERTVEFTLDGKLAPSTQYELRIKAADRTLAAYDGAQFEGESIVFFKTGTTEGALQTEVDPRAASLKPCDATAILQANCAGSTCHGAEKQPPAMGLSLYTEEAIQKTAVNQVAVMPQSAEQPSGTGRTNTSDFPKGLPLISATGARGESSASFLLYKIMMQQPGLKAGQFSRIPFAELRDRIPGAPMPHPSQAPEPGGTSFRRALTLDEIRVIRAWIDSGAKQCGATPPPPTDAGVDATTDATTDDAADAPPVDAADTSVGDSAAGG